MHYLEQGRIYASLILHSPSLTEEQLAGIRAPVLLIAGTLDLIKVSHTKWMKAHIPGSHLILIKGGTHVLQEKTALSELYSGLFNGLRRSRVRRCRSELLQIWKKGLTELIVTDKITV